MRLEPIPSSAAKQPTVARLIVSDRLPRQPFPQEGPLLPNNTVSVLPLDWALAGPTSGCKRMADKLELCIC